MEAMAEAGEREEEAALEEVEAGCNHNGRPVILNATTCAVPSIQKNAGKCDTSAELKELAEGAI
jgi:hypothetical protein